MTTTTSLLIGGLGGMELLIILAVLVLLFGATKLPELARGTGQALRIFKAETKALSDDDRPAPAAGAAQPVAQPVAPPVAQPVVEAPHDRDAARG
ncbi:Sec-independent protein translocase subunit TatA [Nocardioides sp. SYSU D00065]|uniref:Sec-independent protein translocase subunit TatA n=1 Tax=Nocardioides sp. SYSU D00065 TaxID=2817378 RepID=UPI001B340DF1|nr:Sec-independent protein translocase subunit TatA [Nocardioides sp. SYSU D00065]